MEQVKKNNILILSAGRRVELVKIFKDAAYKNNSIVIAADMDETAPALYFADKKEILPRITDESYIKSIIDIVKKHKISLIVPTIDTELLPLVKARKEIENTTDAKVLLSNDNFINLCRDKIAFQLEMQKQGFKMPKLINDINELTHFPVFAKPISGSSSVGAYKIDSYESYNKIIHIINQPMIQEFIDGEEYTIDAFLDFDSNIISIVPRIRLATRSGEILKGKIVKDYQIINEVKKVLEYFKPIGHITLQLIRDENKNIYFIEINPRYGGGAPMSINSGVNTPEFLFRILNDEKLNYTDNYNDGDIHLRFDNSIIIRNGELFND